MVIYPTIENNLKKCIKNISAYDLDRLNKIYDVFSDKYLVPFFEKSLKNISINDKLYQRYSNELEGIKNRISDIMLVICDIYDYRMFNSTSYDKLISDASSIDTNDHLIGWFTNIDNCDYRITFINSFLRKEGDLCIEGVSIKEKLETSNKLVDQFISKLILSLDKNFSKHSEEFNFINNCVIDRYMIEREIKLSFFESYVDKKFKFIYDRSKDGYYEVLAYRKL